MTPQIISALDYKSESILKFVNENHLSYQHLDWLPLKSWLNEPGCFVLLDHGEIQAIISCTAENQESAWLRFFIARRDSNHHQHFSSLLQRSKNFLSENRVQNLFALGLQDWATSLLKTHRFKQETNIVTLTKILEAQPRYLITDNFIIKQMTTRNLEKVLEIDHLSFKPLWQLSNKSLKSLYLTSTYNTVAIYNSEVIGYQISSQTLGYVHLARLAVLPKYQRMQVGFALLTDMILENFHQGNNNFSVNTQQDNPASIHLYEKIGFIKQEKVIPVLCKEISD